MLPRAHNHSKLGFHIGCQLAVLVASLTANPAFTAEFDVKMLNRGSDDQVMVFEPSAIHASAGDTVRFLPIDKGHNVGTVPGLLPPDASPFQGKINEEVVVPFQKPGAYVFKCAPHFGMGMVAVVVVGGTPSNLEAVKHATLPKKAKDRIDSALAALGL